MSNTCTFEVSRQKTLTNLSNDPLRSGQKGGEAAAKDDRKVTLQIRRMSP